MVFGQVRGSLADAIMMQLAILNFGVFVNCFALAYRNLYTQQSISGNPSTSSTIDTTCPTCPVCTEPGTIEGRDNRLERIVQFIRLVAVQTF